MMNRPIGPITLAAIAAAMALLGAAVWGRAQPCPMTIAAVITVILIVLSGCNACFALGYRAGKRSMDQ